MELVYGELNEHLVFLPMAKALTLHGLQMAMSSSQTWGDLKLALPLDFYRGLVLRYREDSELDEDDPALVDGEPQPEAPLDYLKGQMGEGDFPDWPEQDALGWMPKNIQEQFGENVASVHNGAYLELAPKDAEAIVAALSACGYVCKRDDDLIRLASGY